MTANVVMVFDPPQPCTCCGQPAVWHANGVSGCPSYCGSRHRTDVTEARKAVRAYEEQLPAFAEVRAQYAADHPVEPNLAVLGRAMARDEAKRWRAA
jgi:transcription elongation factor Elf1